MCQYLLFLFTLYMCVCFSSDMTVVPPVLDAVIHLPATVHITLRRTSLRLLGELREWIEKHSEYLGTLHCCCVDERAMQHL